MLNELKKNYNYYLTVRSKPFHLVNFDTDVFCVVTSHWTIPKVLIKIQIINVGLFNVIIIKLKLCRTDGGDCRYRTTATPAHSVMCETLYGKVVSVCGGESILVSEPHIFLNKFHLYTCVFFSGNVYVLATIYT